jgi:hypothetical protein
LWVEADIYQPKATAESVENDRKQISAVNGAASFVVLENLVC